MVFLSKEHPLAKKEQLTLKDLESETLIVPTIDMVPSCHKKGMQLRKKSKYKMDIRFANSFEAVKKYIKNGNIKTRLNNFTCSDLTSTKISDSINLTDKQAPIVYLYERYVAACLFLTIKILYINHS